VRLQNGIKTLHYRQLKMSRRGLQAAMRIRWDEAKRQEVLQRRQIDFAVLYEVLSLPYVEDQRSDDPEQYRVIGFGRDAWSRSSLSTAKMLSENICGL
jgi:uncharacterized DUF497 family protein